MTAQQTNRRVLIVDDNRAIHDDFRKILVAGAPAAELLALEARIFADTPVRAAQPLEIRSAYQGEEALAMVKRASAEGTPYGVAFVDMRMPPGWDGVRTISEIWKVDPEVQIVVCTAYSDCSWDALAETAGASDGLLVLKKPFDNVEVSQLVRTLLAKWELRRAMRDRLSDLSSLVARRTEELERANQALKAELLEKKKMQVELRTAERLATVGTLAAGVAHEINNPLAFVIGSLALLAEESPRISPGADAEGAERVDNVIAQARAAAERVREIVRDLKTLSRPEASQTVPVDLERVLESSINMAWNEIRHRARLIKNFAHVPPVEGTESRLGQVFLNLLMNAAQAIPEGDAKAHEIHVSLRTEEGQVIAEVSDTGRGIAPDLLGRVFDPFFTTKAAGEGTGLGLAICHGIVTSAGGEISVRSEPGKGTTFTVRLPAGVRSAPERPAAKAAVETARRGRVLVIDDEPMLCHLVRDVLKKAHDVVTVTSGSAALEQVTTAGPFDVIFCDLMMPQMSGEEVHAELARRSPESAGRMIFLTGGAFTPRTAAFLESVPNLRIEKPFDVGALRALVADRVRASSC
jgi:two-component system NtrC family sensor kinase